MSAMASRITNVYGVYSTVCTSADQRKHQSSASLAFVRGIHRWPTNSPHKGPVTRNCFHLMTSSWLLVSEPTYHWVGTGEEYDPGGFHKFQRSGSIRYDMAMGKCVIEREDYQTRVIQWFSTDCHKRYAYVCQLPLGKLAYQLCIR